MFIKTSKIINETLDLTVLAKKEIDSISNEIDMQNERLLKIQQKSGETDELLTQNDLLLDRIFQNTKFSYAIIILFTIILVMLVIFVKTSLF